MAYPSAAEIQQRAAEVRIGAIDIFAFAALQGRLPTDEGDTYAGLAAVFAWAESARVNRGKVYGFVQAMGRLPTSTQELTDFTARVGAPVAGQGYPPTGTASGEPATTAAATDSAFSFSKFVDEHRTAVYIGGGLLALYVLTGGRLDKLKL